VLTEVTPRPRPPDRAGSLSAILPAVLIIWGFVGAYLLQLAIDRAGENRMREKAAAEMAYFPSGRFVSEASIEFQSLAADLIWLRGIQYYGYHLMSDRKYEWLGHVFDILTSLDPRFIGAYHFGGITLAWDAGKPHEAIDFLVKGMKANPMSWQIPFDAGFICYMLLHDYGRASAFFEVASKMPNAWFILARWAAIAKSKSGDYQTAREMWLDILRGTENRKLKELVVRQLTILKLEETLAQLQAAVHKFEEDKKRLPTDSAEYPFYYELLDAGYIERIPEEPFGGRFYLKDGKVLTTTPPSQRE
jgi:tetratricopeptide (TPR) repeat protein